MLDVDLACDGRQWLIRACSMKDVDAVRAAFEEFGQLLLPADEAAPQEPPAENVNRI